MAEPMDEAERIERLAEQLYRAYSVVAGGHSVVTGAALPEWAALGDEVQSAWIAVATEANDWLYEQTNAP